MHKKIWAAEKSFIIDYQSRTENATADQVAAAEQAFGAKPLPEILSLDGSTATIKIEGVLTRSGPSWLDRYFGYAGTGYNQILESIKIVSEMEEIDIVKLAVDSPGGEVTGVDEVYQALQSLSKKKKVIAENHGLMASAAYWISSIAREINATSAVSETGSIGVIITVVDYSKAYEEYGVKIVKIVSKNAPKKAPNVAKKEGRDVLQDRVDAIERVFIKRVAEGRKKSPHEVIKNFGEGGLLIAQDPDEKKEDAISVGMIDRVVKFNVDSIPESTNDKDEDFFSQNQLAHGAVAAIEDSSPKKQSGEKNKLEGKIMPLKELLEKNPGAAVEIQKELSDKFAEGKAEGKKESKEHIEKCSKYLGNENYKSKSFQNLVLKALKGESSIDAVEGAAAVLDVNLENNASKDAKDETGKQVETPGQNQNLAKGDEAEFQETLKHDKKVLGIEK